LSARPRRSALLLAALVVSLVGGAPAASAANDGDLAWGIRPVEGEHGAGRANFRFTAPAGTVIADALVVTNRGTRPLALRLYGADGVLRDGHVEIAPAEQPAAELGAWLDVAPELDLDPGESVEVPFRLTVPDDAAGEHAGALVTAALSETDGGLAVDRRLAASIVVTVEPGDHGTTSSDATTPDEAPSAPDGPPVGAVLAVLGLGLVAAAVWVVVLRGRATR